MAGAQSGGGGAIYHRPHPHLVAAAMTLGANGWRAFQIAAEPVTVDKSTSRVFDLRLPPIQKVSRVAPLRSVLRPWPVAQEKRFNSRERA